MVTPYRVVKGPQPLKLIPTLTACTSERMKPERVSYFAGFAAWERTREAKPAKTRKSGSQPLFRQPKADLTGRPLPYGLTDVALRKKDAAAAPV